jgi:molybdate transport system ATP-binding protein
MQAELNLTISLAYPGFVLEVQEVLALSGVTALFGPSGSGKTSLLRVIAGLETGAKGNISFGREQWLNSDTKRFVPPHQRSVGYVFQDARLFGHHSVAGNLAFAAKRSRAPTTLQDEVVQALDLGPLLTRRTAGLSGGERQRVALGRALLTQPRLLLLDEPLAALDQRRKADILPYLHAITRRFALPTLYVSHAIDEVAQLADHMAVMDAGCIIAKGPTAQMMERLDLQPLTGRFEAGVLLQARVLAHDTHFQLTRLDLDGQTLTMPMLEHLAPGDEVRVRIRARDVALATQRPEGLSIRNMLSGVVADVSEDPSTAFAEVLVDTGGARLRARITREACSDLALKPGAPVFALVKSVSFDRRGLAESGDGLPASVAP